MTRIGIFGAAGRMGHAITSIIGETPGCEPGPAIDKGDDPAVFTADNTDVLIDFSSPIGLEDHIAIARRLGVPIVVGTTGLDPQHHALIDTAAHDVAILQTGNTSLGVNLMIRCLPASIFST